MLQIFFNASGEPKYCRIRHYDKGKFFYHKQDLQCIKQILHNIDQKNIDHNLNNIDQKFLINGSVSEVGSSGSIAGQVFRPFEPETRVQIPPGAPNFAHAIETAGFREVIIVSQNTFLSQDSTINF